jgi:alpha-galactosidase
MPKIVLIGAGSYVFARDIITDVLLKPSLKDSSISLVDIDPERLNIMTAFTKKLVEQQGFKTRIDSTTDRKEALDGADYVITAIRAGGWKPVLENRLTALKYGLEACPDQMGTGGVFGAVRQIPAILDICHDMEKLCPNALLINYSNPMAMICWAINDYSHIKAVGLCPNAHGGATRLANYAGAKYEDCSYWAAGINHFTWYLDFRVKGEDVYPLFRKKFQDPKVYMQPDYFGKGVTVDVVEVEMLKNFGYFTSGSQAHLSMYMPYFRRKPELAEKYHLDDYGPIFGGAPKRTADETEELKKQVASGYKFEFTNEYRWSLHAADVMDSMETGTIRRIDGNVKNKGLITNLLEGCCVEVPCLVDKEGIHPCHIGDLPSQCATLNRANIGEQELAVRGIVEKDKKKIFQSILIDPLAASLMTIDECREMVDRMFVVDKIAMKGYK